MNKTIDAYQLGIRNYPRFWGFHNYLSINYIDLGQCEEGLKEGLEAARLEPNVEHPYRRQLDAYIWNAVQLPEIRAAIALSRDQPARSVELLASASPYERSYLGAVYLRGLAYLMLHSGGQAVAEFQKIVDHKGANWTERVQNPGQFYALSYFGMARGFALAGDTAKAKSAFQDFFELWKDADPDISILKQAKAEYAKLQ